MVRKIELRVCLQLLIASQNGPRVGKAAAGQTGEHRGLEHLSSPVDVGDAG